MSNFFPDIDVDRIIRHAAIGAVGIGVLAVVCGMLAGWFMFAPAPPKPEPPTPIVATWATWIIEHRKTCPTCQKAWDTADSAMCEEAFAKVMEEVKRLSDEKLKEIE